MESSLQRSDLRKTRQPRKMIRFWIAIIITVSALSAGGFFAITRYQAFRRVEHLRNLLVTGRYEIARSQLEHWLNKDPASREAHYFKAWNALAQNKPKEAVEAIDQARRLGFDPDRLDCLSAIYHARADRFREAEPVLERAFVNQTEPREMVAKELAKIYLMSYRMDRAAKAIERWRALAPEDPEPCLWSNEIASRLNAETAVLIQNYRAALDRDPDLDKARLGLAQALSKDRRFDDARGEFEAYLKRKPGDTTALLGLGRDAFQQGDLDAALRFFEIAFQDNQRDPQILKELGQLDLRLGRLHEARERLQLLSEIQPFDHDVRYMYARALELIGSADQAKKEFEHAMRLRKEHDQIVRLRYSVLKNPNDLETRFQIASWMMQHGHEDEGLKWTKEILRANPSHSPTHSILADYYSAHGQPGLANFHRLSAQDTPRGEIQ